MSFEPKSAEWCLRVSNSAAMPAGRWQWSAMVCCWCCDARGPMAMVDYGLMLVLQCLRADDNGQLWSYAGTVMPAVQWQWSEPALWSIAGAAMPADRWQWSTMV